jgi:1,4-alpha-glucan branching enzyme
MNTDSMYYGGSNLGNFPGITAAQSESHGKPFSIEVTLPPLAVVVLKPQR